MHKAPTTFEAKDFAVAWLAAERRLIEWGEWTPPAEREKRAKKSEYTVATYFDRFLDVRAKPLTPKTRFTYKNTFDTKISEPLGDLPLWAVSPEKVVDWYTGLDHSKPAAVGHAYQALRAMFNHAVEAGEVHSNPCQIKGAGRTAKRKNLDLLSAAELDAVVQAMPEHYKVPTLVAAWCALRFGELIELRRKDVTSGGAVLRIRRSAVLVGNKYVVGPPKTDEGKRDVTIPPHIAAKLAIHMGKFTEAGPEALVFRSIRGTRLTQSSYTKALKAALATIGRTEVRVHDLRHFGAVAAAQAGGTTAELMGRLGHASPAASMRYQHVARGRDAEIAERMSKQFGGQAESP